MDAPPGRRRQARERALGFLYEAETKEVHPAEVVASLPVEPDAYATELAVGVGDHRFQIDHLITRIAAPKWPLARMPAMDRAVLRMGVFELAHRPDVPSGVVQSEAADLAAQFSTDDSARFVNGVLAEAARRVRDDGIWPRPEVVLFDCDGLFRLWRVEPIHDGERRLGLPEGALAAAAFAPERFRPAMVGELSQDEWIDDIAAAVAASTGVEVDRDEVAAVWGQENWEVDEGVVQLTRRLRDEGRVRVALFSNASTKLEGDLESMGIADLFEVVVNSARIGLAKPDPAAFAEAARLVGVEPPRILFVDDRAENVTGALDAGLQAVIHATHAPRLEPVLRRLALLTD